jgi:DNA adenine methylase
MSKFNTPLRYPGGKQRLTPFVIDILRENEISGHYVEPFAGGAGVAIELLLAKQVSHIHLNDSNKGIYAFWYSILNHPEEICKMISAASLTVEEWKRQKLIVQRNDTTNLLELGFAIFYLNRCNRSGVLSAGVIGGMDQSGNYKMDARFSRNDLIRRVETIAIYQSRISIANLDAEKFIDSYIPNLPDDSLVYFDPPYFEKGSELYLNSYKKGDHERIAKTIQKEVFHKWILSYDGVPDILKLYKQRRHFLYELQYSAGKNYKGNEVFVFSDRVNLPTECVLENIHQGLKSVITL